ncbi:MAG: hypothetical protein ACKO7B_15270 [Flavobacteriales bacterium]
MLKQEGCDVTVYSDSKYVVDAVEKNGSRAGLNATGKT